MQCAQTVFTFLCTPIAAHPKVKHAWMGLLAFRCHMRKNAAKRDRHINLWYHRWFTKSSQVGLTWRLHQIVSDLGWGFVTTCAVDRGSLLALEIIMESKRPLKVAVAYLTTLLAITTFLHLSRCFTRVRTQIV